MPTSDELPIRRCVCAGVTFETMRQSRVRSLADAARLDCGVHCGLCREYIERMIETGETAFAAD